MVHILDIIIVLEHIDELLHVLDVGLIGQGDIVLGDHPDKMPIYSRKPQLFNA